MTNASDYLIERDSWLQKLGARNPGERIEQSCSECFPKVLRGRPTYDRLPGAAQAYNKENNDYLSRGTIIIPEAPTVVSSAEDVFFRERFPEEYAARDYISGSYFGPGSGAALILETLKPLTNGTNITNLELILRSATVFWGESKIRDSSNISKDTQLFPGLILTLPLNYNGWIFINGAGALEIQEQLPDGVLNLTENIWCNSNSDAKICAKRIRSFADEDALIDKLDLAEGSNNSINNGASVIEPLLYEVSPLYKFSTTNGTLTLWEDYRRFNREFDAPIARWLTDHADNLLMDKKEQIDTFFDDYLYPDSVGLFLLRCDGPIRSSYKPENATKIIDSWDFGLINEESLDGPFNFITNSELDDLINYDFYTNKILDWLAQHFGFIDNGTETEVWHVGSSYNRPINNGAVYYNISEKRAILRNAYNQDTFQEYNYEAKEFYFTRFPFSLYNRLKPNNWEGLLKARGTEKALEFMFDVLGLHGYQSYTIEPRYIDSLLDFNVPLDLIKYTNKPLVNYIKELSPSGTIIDKLPLTYNDINYSETGVFKVGESIFADGHDKRYVLRVPFSWDRPSKNWNRVKEISSTYALNDTVNVGYYYYVAGKSAIGECIFNNESTYTSEYITTDRFIELDSDVTILSPYMIFESESTKYIKRPSLDNQVNLTINPSVTNNIFSFNFIDPIYCDDSTIFCAMALGNGVPDSRIKQVPLLVSIDNGDNFSFSQAIINNMSESYRIRSISKMKIFNGTVYIIGKDTLGSTLIYHSIDNGATFSLYDTPVGVPYDVFYDEEAKVTYLAMNSAAYYKYDSNNVWVPLLTEYYLEPSDTVTNAEIFNNNNGTYVIITYNTGANSSQCKILYTNNKGVNKFLLHTSPINNGTSSQLRLQVAPYTVEDEQFIEFCVLTGAEEYSTNTSKLTIRSFNGDDFIDVSSLFKDKLKELVLKMDATIISNEVDTLFYNNSSNYEYIAWNNNNLFNNYIFSDIIFNYETNTFNIMVTLVNSDVTRGKLLQESIIVSFARADFSDIKIVKRGLYNVLRKSSLAVSMPNHFIQFRRRIESIKRI